MKPRVALVTRALRCGGVGTFLLRLGGHLVRSGCAVDIFTTEEAGDWFDRAAPLGIRASAIPGARARPPVLHALRVGRRLAESGADAVILNHAPHAQLSLGMLPDRVFTAPVLHMDAEEIYRVGLANPRAWNAAVAVSPRLREVALARVPGRPVAMILHGVETAADAGPRARSRAELPLRLAAIGRFDDREKGTLLLPEVLAACVRDRIDVRLDVAGDGPDREALAGALRRLDLEERVRMHGPLPPERIYELLLESHALLLPSRIEGFGLVALEAQACGCAPIASRLPGVTDVAIEDGRTGFLLPVGDAAAFARALSSLDRDRPRWLAMAGAGIENVARRFTVARMGDEWLRLIEDGLAGRYPAPAPRRLPRPLDAGLFTWRDFLPPPALDGVRRWLRPRPRPAPRGSGVAGPPARP